MSAPALDSEREALRGNLRETLVTHMRKGALSPWSGELFNELALEVFRYQAGANPVYRALLQRRGLDAGSIRNWRHIPPVPTRAFKDFLLRCDAPESPAATFLTSGTTSGPERRGRHPVRDLDLYRASLLSSAEAWLHPYGTTPGLSGADSPSLEPAGSRRSEALRFLALSPAPEQRPDSSLAFMLGTLYNAWDDGQGGFFCDANWTLRSAELDAAVARASREGVTVLIAGTAFAFVHWIERGRADGTHRTLPQDSVVMETGGYKGRSVEVPRVDLYRQLGKTLGLPVGRIVNEYGMTEMLSQFYEPTLLEFRRTRPDPGSGSSDLAHRRHHAPPWLRTLVLDPVNLDPVPDGEPGILMHLDLANLDSVSAVLTEDLGRMTDDGLLLLGRTSGAESRGCSLTMEDLVAAQKGRA
jgi:hypothetical protein